MATFVYCCGGCGEEYDWRIDAQECCAPVPDEAWKCDICYIVHYSEEDAENCCPEPNEHENDCVA